MNKTVQYFSDEYLKQCQSVSTEEILEFLENFRTLHSETHPSKSKLISIKIPEDLLQAFRFLSQKNGIPYQTQIKKLMKEWVAGK